MLFCAFLFHMGSLTAYAAAESAEVRIPVSAVGADCTAALMDENGEVLQTILTEFRWKERNTMSKPKGTRDRATVEKMKKAPDKLEGQKALRAMLYQKVSKTEQEIIAGQFKLQELKKKITACNREIASLNKMIIENNS